MQYLVAAYGPDKLNNPAEAEPIVKKMIDMEPNEPVNYFALSKIYEDAGRYEEAEQTLLKAKEIKPNDPVVYTTLSGFYNRQGDFEKTMEALHQAAELKPNNPTGYQLVATYYWEKAFKDHRLLPAQKKDYIMRGHRGDRQGHLAQPGLRRRDDLQEHPAPHAGQCRDRSGQA